MQMNSRLHRRTASWLKTAVPALLVALPAVAEEKLSLEQCLHIAHGRNLQRLSDLQDLERSRAQLLGARSPFELQADANLQIPSFRETRDTQENVALLRRVRAEDTDFQYGGQLTVTQRVPNLGQFSLTSNAARRDFSSNRRADFLDFSGDVRLGYRHEIFTTAQEEFALERARLNLDGAGYNYGRQLLNLEQRVVGAYYDLVRSIRQLEIEQQSLEQSEASLELAKRKFEVGLIAEVEALRWQVALLRARADFDQAETEIERRRDLLRDVLGMEMDEPLEVVSEVESRRFAIDAARALELGLERRTDLRQAEIQEEIRQLSLQERKRNSGPVATLNASVGVRGRGSEVGDISSNLERNLWSVGIDVTMPVLDGGSRRSSVNEAQVDLEKSRIATSLRKREIVREIRNTVRNLAQAERQIDLRRAALEFAERTYEVEQSRFELGLIQSQDLLDTQGELTQARIDELDSVVNYRRQLVDLKVASMAELSELAP
jgi:outer membrane protein